MSSSKGVICNAGFVTPSEALYLGKRLLVIPLNGQYEQHCNVAALEKIGVLSLNNLNYSNTCSLCLTNKVQVKSLFDCYMTATKLLHLHDGMRD